MIISGTKYAQFAKRLPSWLYKLGAQTWIDKKWPRHLFIETTANCNLKCEYCPREKIRNNMDFNLFRSIVDEAARYGPRSFSLHLFGEPLLYPQFFEAVEYIKKKNKKNTVLLTSNGTLFERFIDDLLVSGVDKVLWSWRPEPEWSESTIVKLKKWKAFTVRIIEEVTPSKIKEEFLKWPRVERRNLHSYGGKIDLQQFGVQNTDLSRQACYHLFLAPAVSWDGKFLMCCADPKKEEIFGDINKESVAECWQRLEKVRQAHLRREFSGICSQCTVPKAYPDLFFSWQYTG